MMFSGGCASVAAPVASEPTQAVAPGAPAEPLPVQPLPLTEIEKRIGFDVQEPGYVPEGVYFDSASLEETPHARVTLHFNLKHEQYGDLGPFFMITQEPQADAPGSCDGCETLQVGDRTVQYQLNKSTENPGADTEMLVWESDGFVFQLFRNAGEPNKIYKDELLKVAGSMK
jgi:hypothetical protein